MKMFCSKSQPGMTPQFLLVILFSICFADLSIGNAEAITVPCKADVTVEKSDTCSKDSTCTQIMTSLDSWYINTGSGLSCPQIFDHVANRLGYGISPAASPKVKDTVRADVRALVLRVSNALNGKIPMIRSNKLQTAIDTIAPNQKLTSAQLTDMRNGLISSQSDLKAQLDSMQPETCTDQSTSSYCQTLATYNDTTSQLRYINSSGSVVQDFSRMKALRAALGSQYYEGDTLRDSQENLSEVLLEFWYKRFNIDGNKAGRNMSGVDGYENTIFKNQFSTFKDLLIAVETHPAMLFYLDVDENDYDLTNNSPGNQNLGRELLELHTIGKPVKTANYTISPYTQDDIVNTSLILTGMTSVWDSINYGAFFDSTTHEPSKVIDNGQTNFQGQNQGVVGPKYRSLPDPIVMGKSYPFTLTNYGSNQQDWTLLPVSYNGQLTALLTDLANHPSTIQSVCNQLANFLIRDPNLVDANRQRCVDAYGLNGDLKKMYAASISDPGFWALSNYRNGVQNPFELAVSFVRKTGVNLKDLTLTAQTTGLFTTFPMEIAETIRNISSDIGLDYRGYSYPTGYDLNGLDWLSKGYLDSAALGAFKSMNLQTTYTKQTKDIITQVLGSNPPQNTSETDKILYQTWVMPQSLVLSSDQVNACSQLTVGSSVTNTYSGDVVPTRMYNLRTLAEFLAVSNIGLKK